MKTALLVVDVQNALMADHPFNEAGFLAGLETLLSGARRRGVEVIHVQHDGGPGDELEKGTPGWAVYPPVAPAPGERVFDKEKNSAFKNTGLHDYLQSQGIGRLVLAGMQSEYCIDATCKSAFDLGYTIVIPEGCTTTFDNDWFSGEKLARYFEQKIWKDRFAAVVPPADAFAD